MPSRSTCIKILLIYALYTNSQGKCPLYFIKFILTEKWVCCKHFKSFIFEVFVDKRGQVAGDSMTHSRRSSGGSRLLMKALASPLFRGRVTLRGLSELKDEDKQKRKWKTKKNVHFVSRLNVRRCTTAA